MISSLFYFFFLIIVMSWDDIYKDNNFIISLTSYPTRIKLVHTFKNNLLNKSMKPDKIILWFAN